MKIESLWASDGFHVETNGFENAENGKICFVYDFSFSLSWALFILPARFSFWEMISRFSKISAKNNFFSEMKRQRKHFDDESENWAT